MLFNISNGVWYASGKYSVKSVSLTFLLGLLRLLRKHAARLCTWDLIWNIVSLFKMRNYNYSRIYWLNIRNWSFIDIPNGYSTQTQDHKLQTNLLRPTNMIINKSAMKFKGMNTIWHAILVRHKQEGAKSRLAQKCFFWFIHIYVCMSYYDDAIMSKCK